MNKRLFNSVVLYGFLGFLLSVAGVGIVEQPVTFIAILLNVMLIDIV